MESMESENRKVKKVRNVERKQLGWMGVSDKASPENGEKK